MSNRRSVCVVGGGLVGPVVALYLANRGYAVHVYERGPDPRFASVAAGRSVHLVVSARGWRALDGVGLERPIMDAAIPLQGRAIHHESGSFSVQPYGVDGQAIYAVQRSTLNKIFIDAVSRHPDVTVHFDHRCIDVDLETCTVELEDAGTQERRHVTADAVIGADGAFSRVRGALMRTDRFDYAQEYMPYGYKELRIPEHEGGGFPLDPRFMHVWPRTRLMLSAFPNPDKSFTAMLVMPFEGPGSFAKLQTEDSVARLFREEFADALPLMPTLTRDFFSRRPSSLITVRCYPWTHEGKLALIGDAAHAMVPFFGQGMNAGLEDCVILDACLERHGGSFQGAFEEYQRLRKPDCDAVTEMSFQNFVELSERVADPKFLLQKRLEQRIHRMYPDRFAPLYAMVAFGHMPYAEAREVARAQRELVGRIMAVERLEERWDAPEVDELIHRCMQTFNPRSTQAREKS